LAQVWSKPPSITCNCVAHHARPVTLVYTSMARCLLFIYTVVVAAGQPPQLRGAAPANQSQLEQSLTAESYPHFDAHGCDGGCDCDWLPGDNCQEQSWCCAWACRDKYHNPAECPDPGSEYGQIEWGGCDGGCNCDWLSRDNCQDTEWCCAGACRDYYYNPAGCSGAALLANQSQLEQSLTAESYPQGGLSSGPSYYCGGTWNGNNNWGSNYEGPIVNTDTETCKWLCGVSGSNKCTGWTVTNNNECYLKTSVGDMQSDTGVQGSGYCYPSCGDQQNQQNNDGQNYEGPIQVQNAEFCKVRCQASGGQCKGWTVTNNGECYLKDSVGPMRPDGGVQASGNC